MSDKKKNPVPLSAMVEAGDTFIASNGKEYIIEPLKLKEVDVFTKDGLSVGSQLFNLTAKGMKPKLAKWVKLKFKDKEGNEKTLEDLEEEGWTIVDLKNAIRKLADISG